MSIGITGYYYFIAYARKAAEADYFALYDHFRDRSATAGQPLRFGTDNPEPDIQSETIDSVEETKLTFVLLTVAYLEALANLYLSLKMDAQAFDDAKWKPLAMKWRDIPASFLPNYKTPPNDVLDDLESLVKRRNRIVHPKPEVSRDGQIVHAGFEPPSEIDHGRVVKWTSLPAKLGEHIGIQDFSQEGRFFRSLVEEAEYRAPEAHGRRMRALRSIMLKSQVEDQIKLKQLQVSPA